jgi:hypothetical protein
MNKNLDLQVTIFGGRYHFISFGSVLCIPHRFVELPKFCRFFPTSVKPPKRRNCGKCHFEAHVPLSYLSDRIQETIIVKIKRRQSVGMKALMFSIRKETLVGDWSHMLGIQIPFIQGFAISNHYIWY